MEGETSSWSKQEVLELIGIWAEDHIQGQLAGMKRNKRVFELIARELTGRGYPRTFVQCRNKIKALKADYKKVKDNNNKYVNSFKIGLSKMKFRLAYIIRYRWLIILAVLLVLVLLSIDSSVYSISITTGISALHVVYKQ